MQIPKKYTGVKKKFQPESETEKHTREWPFYMDSEMNLDHVIDNIVEFIDLQRRFNLDIDKRVTSHGRILVKHERSITKLRSDYKITWSALKDMKRYFAKRK